MVVASGRIDLWVAPTISYKVFGGGSSFRLEWCTAWGVSFLLFGSFARIGVIFVLAGEGGGVRAGENSFMLC